MDLNWLVLSAFKDFFPSLSVGSDFWGILKMGLGDWEEFMIFWGFIGWFFGTGWGEGFAIKEINKIEQFKLILGSLQDFWSTL